MSTAAYMGVGAGGRRCSDEEIADMEREAREMLADPRGETAVARHYDFPATVPSRHLLAALTELKERRAKARSPAKRRKVQARDAD